MRIKEYLLEAKPNASGNHRLVTSILNMISKQGGRQPSRYAVKSYLKVLEKDKDFLDRLKKKAKQYGNEGIIWATIRMRAVNHFADHTV